MEPEPASKAHRPEAPPQPRADPLAVFTKFAPNVLPDPIDQKALVTKVPKSQHVPWFGLKPTEELFVRKPYFALWDAVLEQLSEASSNGLIVTGNPGIGKSVGGINTIAALSIQDDAKVHSGERLLVVLKNEACHLFMNGLWHQAPGLTPIERAAAVSGVLLEIARSYAPDMPLPKVLLLHDVKSSQDASSSFAYQSWFVSNMDQLYLVRKDTYDVHCVLFASPQVGNSSEFEKDFPGFRLFYMPTWSLDELEAVGRDGLRCPAGVELADRFSEVGGIVRWIKESDDFLFKLKAARADALSSEKFKETFNRRGQFSFTATNKLFQLVPSPGYRRFSVSFLCDAARKAWYDARKAFFGEDALTMLEWAIQAESTAEVIGRHLEAVFRHRLQHDDRRLLTVTYLGESSVKPRTLSTLLSAATHVPPAAPQTVLRSAGRFATDRNIAVLELPAVTITSEFTGQEPKAITDKPGLYVPRNSNFPFVDFVLVTEDKEAWMFQVTVSNQHSPSKAQYDAFVDHFTHLTPPLTPYLVWVGFDGKGVSTLQRCSDNTPISIPQFFLRLGISQPEVWLREVDSGTQEPQSFSCLLSADSKEVVEVGLKKLDPALQLHSKKDDASSSSPARPWRFKWKAVQ